MEHFGKHFAALRRAQGMTQEDIAAAVGISSQAVSKWENGASYPDITLLPALASLLDTSIDALLGQRTGTTLEAVDLQILRLFETTPPADVFATALHLAGRLHEGAATLGYTQRVPWQINKDAPWPLDADLSARTEPDGASIRAGRTAFFSAAGGQPVNATKLRQLATLLAQLLEKNVLSLLFALEDGLPHTTSALGAACHLTPDEVAQGLHQLPTEETDAGFVLDGCFGHIPYVLRLCML